MILYKAGFSLFSLSWLLLIQICILIICFYCWYKNCKRNCGTLFILTAAGILLLIALIGNLYDIISPIIHYYSGDYKIVEGYVENFVPCPFSGHAMETFSINGVEFSYADDVIKPGYRKTYYHGGYVRGNGQHLKIGYVEYNGDNAIIYMEDLSDS